MSKTNPAGRVVLFDEVRGLCLILMVFYHGMLDLVTSGVDLTWFFSSVMQRFLQPAVAGTFIFISGAVSRYSRSNLRRGLAALACAFAVTVVTRHARSVWHPASAGRVYAAVYSAAAAA